MTDSMPFWRLSMRRGSRAFTLIELLVVIAIFSASQPTRRFRLFKPLNALTRDAFDS